MNLSNIIIHFIVFMLQIFDRGSAFDEDYDTYDLSLEVDEDRPGLRIINGKEAKLGDFPYQISFKKWSRIKYVNFCGGTLIQDDVIISAAHCFKKAKVCDCCPSGNIEDKVIKKFWAVAGSIATSEKYAKDKENRGQWRKLKSIKYHKSFKFPRNDISVAKVKEKFKLNANINIIPMASVDKDYKGTCLVSGFGRVSKGKQSAVLMYAEVEVVPKAACKSFARQSMGKFVCTSVKEAGTAQGDSGGPLVCKQTGDPADKGKGILVGVLSGRKSRKWRPKEAITMFTRVTSHVKFLDEAFNRGNCYSYSSPIVFLCLIKISFYFHLNDFNF